MLRMVAVWARRKHRDNSQGSLLNAAGKTDCPEFALLCQHNSCSGTTTPQVCPRVRSLTWPPIPVDAMRRPLCVLAHSNVRVRNGSLYATPLPAAGHSMPVTKEKQPDQQRIVAALAEESDEPVDDVAKL